MPADSFAKVGYGGRSNNSMFSSASTLVVFVVAYLLGNMTMQLLHHTGPSSVDHGRRVGGESQVPRQEQVLLLEPEPACNKLEDFIDFDGDYYNFTITENAWRQMKWVLPPAKCRVKGHLIERLDPTFNWRRGVALRFTEDDDDKTHIQHWFYGARVDLNKRKRRVYIDLGANGFETSVLWMNINYPVDFTEVHAFEAKDKLFRLPTGFVEEDNFLDNTTEGFVKVKQRNGFLPKWMLNRISIYNTFVGLEDGHRKVNITRFIKDELGLTAEDAVIVKMDIEVHEWPILKSWAQDPDLPNIIDELLVEIHYYHPPDNRWVEAKDYSRVDTVNILAELRFKGWYVHYWS